MAQTYGNTDYRRYNDQRSRQAEITATYYIQSIPQEPLGGNCYPARPVEAPSTVREHSLVMVNTKQALQTMSSGPTSSAITPNFGNQPIPEVGKEDLWAAGWNVGGIVKNTITDTEGNLFLPNGGKGRINSKQAATQVAGSHNLDYTNPTENTILGDIIIWKAPPVKTGRLDVALPMLAPLHWSLYVNLAYNIYTVMIELEKGRLMLPPSNKEAHQQYLTKTQRYGPLDWSKAAEEKKRYLLVMIMAGIIILVKRGFIRILTPDISLKEAIDAKFIAKLERLRETGNLNQQNVENLMSERDNDINNVPRHNPNVKNYTGYSYYPGVGKVSKTGLTQIFSYDRESEGFMTTFENTLSPDTTSLFADTSKNMQNGIDWMINGVGLGPNSGNKRGLSDTTAHNTVYNILDCCSIGAHSNTNLEEAKPYLKTIEESLGASIGAENNPVMSNLKSHLDNAIVGEEAMQQIIRDGIRRRVVGKALSSAAGGSSDMGEFQPTIDLDLYMGAGI